MEARHHLRCLGQPALFAPNGEPIRFRTKKHLALLVYLAVESRRPHRRDRLAEFLWPRAATAEARHSLATALSVYATNATLDPTKMAASYGFTVSGDGAGTATANVGSNGDAFGVANNTKLTLMDLLLAADAQAVNGVLYGGNAAKRNIANNIYNAVNQAGGIN